MDAVNIQLYLPDVLWVAFSIPSGALSLVKYPIFTDMSLVITYFSLKLLGSIS
jgi:hypothetical protein